VDETAGLIVRLRRAGYIANGVGSVVVFNTIGSLIPIFLDPDQRGELGLRNGPLVAAFVIIGGMVTAPTLRRRILDAIRWVAEDREANNAERLAILGLPHNLARVSAAGWIASVPVFFAVNAPTSVGFATVAAATITLGGITTAALVYLLSERILRPMTGRALSTEAPVKPVGPGVRGRLITAWALGTGIPLLGIFLVALVGATKSNVETGYLAGATLPLVCIAFSVGLLVTIFAARAIADPVISVREGLEQVQQGEFGVAVPVNDGTEIGLLQAGFNQMAEGLREREQIRDLFGRHVGRDVASAAIGQETELGGEEREISALFIDVVASTSMAAELSPTEVVGVLNRFFEVVVDVSEAEGGFVNKFQGDAALCVFGAPVANSDHAGDALRAARRLAAGLRRTVPEIDFGIGVSAGRAVAGNVGAEQRFEYTVIGDPVNEAARLCELAKDADGRVLASAAALERAGDGEAEEWKLGEAQLLRGRSEPTVLAEPRDVGQAG
jgi:class 3 adenylate cyclase